jgi:hypothetical protein
MNAFKITTIIVLVNLARIIRADPLDDWTLRAKSPVSLSAIAYGNGQFVAVGSAGAILTSADGADWVSRESGTQRNLAGIAYGGGQFVAVGAALRGTGEFDGFVLTSTAGVNWVESLGDLTDYQVQGITYGNGKFVTWGGSYAGKPTLVGSFDGLNWDRWVWQFTTNRGSITFFQYPNAIGFGGGQFVAVGAYGTLLTSSDGLSWSLRRSGSQEYLGSIAYGNGQFVTLDLYGAILSSPDGLNWVHRQSAPGYSPFSIAFGNGQFVAVGGVTMLTSADGTNWAKRDSATINSSDLRAVTYGNGHFLAVGMEGAILESGAVITLALTSKRGAEPLSLSVTGPTNLGYTIQSSTDLNSWRAVTNFTSSQPTSIIFDSLPASSPNVFYRAYSR